MTNLRLASGSVVQVITLRCNSLKLFLQVNLLSSIVIPAWIEKVFCILLVLVLYLTEKMQLKKLMF